MSCWGTTSSTTWSSWSRRSPCSSPSPRSARTSRRDRRPDEQGTQLPCGRSVPRPRNEDGEPMSILVVDVGTSGVRAAVVHPDATIDHVHYREVLPESPAPGFVQFDAAAMAAGALD